MSSAATPPPVEATAGTRRPRWLKWVLGTLGVLTIFVLGMAAGGNPPAEPEVVTKTETEVVTETPQSCLDALEMAERIVTVDAAGAIEIGGELAPMIYEGMQAVLQDDYLTIESINDRLDSFNTRMEKLNRDLDRDILEYNGYAEDCRAGGGSS